MFYGVMGKEREWRGYFRFLGVFREIVWFYEILVVIRFIFVSDSGNRFLGFI